MRLSEALRHADRIGIPECRGVYIPRLLNAWVDGQPVGCALGAAAIVTGGFVIDWTWCDQLGWLLTDDSARSAMHPRVLEDIDHFRKMRCPAESCEDEAITEDSLRTIVVHLYDVHEWSRTAIGDWLDALEAT